MSCEDVKLRLLDFQRERLAPEEAREVREHLRTCSACARDDVAERSLSERLEARLPRYPARPALKRRLRALLGGAPSVGPVPSALARWIAPALAAGLLVATFSVLYAARAGRGDALAGLTAEAVNDYLRVLASQHRVEVEGGGPHRVKPWFEGRLDFAPDVPEPAGLALQGGAVGYFRDRRAAVLVYGLRLHTVVLLEVRAGDLAWPADAPAVRAASDRHFNVFFWRSGEIGYALVSDAEPGELGAIAGDLAARR